MRRRESARPGAARDVHQAARVQLLPIAVIVLAAAAPRAVAAEPIHVRAGVSELVHMTSFFGALGAAAEVEGEARLAPAWCVTGGVRIELTSGRPEAFGRISIAPRARGWIPAVGVELGVSARARLRDRRGQLADARAEAQASASPVYVAVHAAPLRFTIGAQWTLSVGELQVGTQVPEVGHWARLQLGLVSVGRAL